MRTALSILCLTLGFLVVSVLTPGAEAAPPDTEDGRFTFHRADNGYLRLDGRTGQVSLCVRRPAGWVCQAVPDDRAALESEIARLQGENAVLKKELLSRKLPLPGGVRPDQAAPKPDDARPRLPDDAELNRVMEFIEKVWRRLVEMIDNVKREILRKT
jgi:hypothetical protein